MASNESPSEVDCTCPVCCDIFKDPVVLLCGHSFCKHCLQEWWGQDRLQKCPVCMEIFPMVQPPHNLSLRNLSDTLRPERSQKATTGSKEFCSLHSEKLKLFCQDDQQLICLICRDAKKHKTHNCVPINEAAEDHRTKLKVQLMHLKSKQGSFEAEKIKCDKMASHITLQAQQTEKVMKEEFQKLYQFLQAEEAARIDAVRKEATLKSEAMKIRIVNLIAESSLLSDKIKAIEQEMKEEDISFMLNVKSSVERSQCNLPEPETPSGALIDEAKHLENLQFTVWGKMRNIIQYTPVKELFRRVSSILNKLMPQNFQQLMKQMAEMTIDTEESLKGVIDLIFEKAISEPSLSVVYANMCRCLKGLKVPMTDQPGTCMNFRKLLLSCCQKEFEAMFERKQKELHSGTLLPEQEQHQEDPKKAKDEAQKRSIGNIKFIGELFKLKMLTEAIMHDSVVKLLKERNEESLECLCTLLTTIGKDLDHGKAKPRMDQYFNQMDKIVKERRTSRQISSMLQDVIDLRSHNWVSKGIDQGPKFSSEPKPSIKKTHKEARIEEQGEQRKVCQHLFSKNSKRQPVKPWPVVQTWHRPALSEEEIERRSKSIINEFLHINDCKEAIQCVDELNLGSQLYIFVRTGVELTLEQSQITRDYMGQLLFQLVQQRILPKPQFYKGFADTLEQVNDMAIDIPHIWLYLAELLSPVLRDGVFSMRELFSELSKPLIPVGKAGILISEVLHILCKQMNDRTMVGSLWRESGLNWTDFLPEGEDVQAFISQQNLQFILSDSSSPEMTLPKRILSPEELSHQSERLFLEDMAINQQIFDWVEANLDESQMSSSPFLRALMTAVCKGAVKDDNTNCRVDTAIIQRRLPVLKKYLQLDTERQLQALYALQALIVSLNQPPNLLRMFFDCLYDEDVISEDVFFKWEMSQDPAEQQGKDVALKSVRAFFIWLREAEEESEDD